jgi:hypothetical protein
MQGLEYRRAALTVAAARAGQCPVHEQLYQQPQQVQLVSGDSFNKLQQQQQQQLWRNRLVSSLVPAGSWLEWFTVCHWQQAVGGHRGLWEGTVQWLQAKHRYSICSGAAAGVMAAASAADCSCSACHRHLLAAFAWLRHPPVTGHVSMCRHALLTHSVVLLHVSPSDHQVLGDPERPVIEKRI